MGDIISPIINFKSNSRQGSNIIVSSNNRIVMFNLETKDEVWKNIKVGTYSTPIISGKSILLIDTNGSLVSLKGDTGEVEWKKALQSKVKTKRRTFWFGPIEIMLVSKSDGTLRSYKKLFSFKKEKVLSPPVVTSEYIVIISSYGNLYINKIKK
jgi:outer membrane protein assembly factor BamB